MSPRRRRKLNLATSVALVFPCLLVYELGLLALGTTTRNGADLLTDLFGSWLGYRTFGLLLLVLFAMLLVYLRRERFDWSALVPVLLESTLYAVTMGTVIVFVMVDLIGIPPQLAVPYPSAASKVVLSLGAGLHEELLFRVIVLGGVVLLLERFKVARPFAVLAGCLVSAALFAAAHHVGPYGDPLRRGIFTYRFLAGLVFAALYWFRGFPVAVYTHALYDVYVLLVR